MTKHTRWDGAIAALFEDISDRRGIKWEWNKIDEDVKQQIRARWAALLEKHAPPGTADDAELLEAVRLFLNRVDPSDMPERRWDETIAFARAAYDNATWRKR